MESFIKDKIFEITFSKVESDDSLWQSGILDSITIVELAAEIEDEYNIKIPFDDIIEQNFETVNLLVKFIESKTIS